MSKVRSLTLPASLIATAGLWATFGAGAAHAGPTTWENAGWNQAVTATPGGWFTSTDLGATVIGKAGAAYPLTAFLEARYCNTFGTNTRIVGMGINRARWHAINDDMSGSVTVYSPQSTYTGIDGGAAARKTTQRFLRDTVIDGVQLELPAKVTIADTYRFPAGQCVASRVAVRGGDDRVIDTPGFVPHITQRLTKVLVEDMQGPAVANASVSGGWTTGDTVRLSWDSSDNAYRRGTTGVRVSGGGSNDLGNLANGRHSASAALGALADGAHNACVYRNAPGWPEATLCLAFKLDRTAPAVPQVTVSPTTDAYVNSAITITTGPADDGQGSGWSHNQVRVDGGSWKDTTGIATITADGEHTVQVRAVDRAGHVSQPTPVQTVRVDRTAPIITNLQAAGATGRLSWSMVDAIGLGSCHVKIALSGPGTNGAVVTVVDQSAATLTPSAASVVLPVGTMPNGEYLVRLTVCDSAGNETSTTTALWWTGNPDGVLTGSWAQFVPMSLTSPGVVNRRLVNGSSVPSIRRVVGRQFILTGRLQRPDGSAFSQAAVELRDSFGRYSTGFRTDASGRFTVTTKASVGGAWTLNAVGSKLRQPAAWLAVKPVVSATASMRNGRRTLVVSGRMRPGVSVTGKAVSLQWYDTVTRRWRPVMDGRVSAVGSFRLTYRFSRPGRYSVKVRVVVPRDAGWPYLTGISRSITVRVG